MPGCLSAVDMNVKSLHCIEGYDPASLEDELKYFYDTLVRFYRTPVAWTTEHQLHGLQYILDIIFTEIIN